MALTPERAIAMLAGHLPGGLESIVCRSSIPCCTAVGTTNHDIVLITETYDGGSPRITVVTINDFIGDVKDLYIDRVSLIILTTDGVFRFIPVKKQTYKVIDLALDPEKFYYIAGSTLNGVGVFAVVEDESVTFARTIIIDGIQQPTVYAPISVEAATAFKPVVDPTGRYMLCGDNLFGLHEHGGYLLLSHDELASLASPPVTDIESVRFSATKKHQVEFVNAPVGENRPVVSIYNFHALTGA